MMAYVARPSLHEKKWEEAFLNAIPDGAVNAAVAYLWGEHNNLEIIETGVGSQQPRHRL